MNFFGLDAKDFEECGDLTRLVVLGGKSELGVIERKASGDNEEQRNDHPASEQFIYMLEGTAKIQVGDEVKVIEPEQAIYIPFDTFHSIAALTDIRYVAFYAPPRASSIRDFQSGRKAVYPGG